MNSFPLKLILVSALSISPAYAYLDPGTGSMIVQSTIAGILGIAFAIKMYWYRIKAAFNRMIGRKPVNKSSSEDSGDTQDE